MVFRDRQEISWTIWGPSVPHIWSRPIERHHRRSCSTSRMSRLRSDQRWGAIGHSKVQVISCRSLRLKMDRMRPRCNSPRAVFPLIGPPVGRITISMVVKSNLLSVQTERSNATFLLVRTMDRRTFLNYSNCEFWRSRHRYP